MEIGRFAFDIKKVSINTRLINAVKLALVAVQICLAQRPGLGEVHVIEHVADLDELVVCIAEAVVDSAFSVVFY